MRLSLLGAALIVATLTACPSAGTTPGDSSGCPAPLCVDRGSDGDVVGVALDGANRPLVMYTKATPGLSDSFQTLYVRRLEGGVWKPLGGAIQGEATINWGAELIVDGADRPVLAHAVSVGGSLKIEARRWNGSNWELIGGLVNAAKVTGLAWDGTKYLIFTTAIVGNANAATLADTAGAVWVPFTTPLTDAGVTGGLSGVTPLHLTKTISDTTPIHLFRWSGSAWAAVGGDISLAPDYAQGLTATATQATVLLRRSAGAGNPLNLVAKRSSDLSAGATWADLGQVNATPGTNYGAIVTVAGAPVVAFFEKASSLLDTDTLRLRRYNGTTWEDVAGSSFKDANATALVAQTYAVARGNSVAVVWDSPGGNPGFGIHYRSVTVP